MNKLSSFEAQTSNSFESLKAIKERFFGGKLIPLEINKGDNIGIVGESGSGKSTLIDLLLGFQRPSKGIITVDDIDLNDIILSFRSKIGYVSQELYLIDDSFLNNIAFGINKDEINIERVHEVIKLSQLETLIENSKDGVNTRVGERGVQLSGGQKQRIAIARALYSNPDILILDEATSSIDSYSEEMIQVATEKITKGRTSIIIAHRLATVKKADKIIVMDAGKIVEIGTHKDLLKKEFGYYKNLYEVQFLEKEAI